MTVNFVNQNSAGWQNTINSANLVSQNLKSKNGNFLGTCLSPADCRLIVSQTLPFFIETSTREGSLHLTLKLWKIFIIELNITIIIVEAGDLPGWGPSLSGLGSVKQVSRIFLTFCCKIFAEWSGGGKLRQWVRYVLCDEVDHLWWCRHHQRHAATEPQLPRHLLSGRDLRLPRQEADRQHLSDQAGLW